MCPFWGNNWSNHIPGQYAHNNNTYDNSSNNNGIKQ